MTIKHLELINDNHPLSVDKKMTLIYKIICSVALFYHIHAMQPTLLKSGTIYSEHIFIDNNHDIKAFCGSATEFILLANTAHLVLSDEAQQALKNNRTVFRANIVNNILEVFESENCSPKKTIQLLNNPCTQPYLLVTHHNENYSVDFYSKKVLLLLKTLSNKEYSITIY